MAAVSLFWYTNMAAVTSGENALFTYGEKKGILYILMGGGILFGHHVQYDNDDRWALVNKKSTHLSYYFIIIILVVNQHVLRMCRLRGII